MNRTEWDACKDPLLLLRAMQSQGSDRKFRLLACAVADAGRPSFGGSGRYVSWRRSRWFEEFADGHGGSPGDAHLEGQSRNQLQEIAEGDAASR